MQSALLHGVLGRARTLAAARIAVPGRNCWRSGMARRAAFLIDAGSYFAALAATLERAERSVYILGWDIHSRATLACGEDATAAREIGALLCDIVRRRPRLHVHVLAWDYSMLLAATRELLPWLRLEAGGLERLVLRLDSQHPVGGCHHQKLVVVDDAVAFIGGMDITANRWDTPEHRVEDPRRTNPWGRSYPPFHDVQLALDAEAALLLGRLARARWRRAKAPSAPPQADVEPLARPSSDPWPPELRADLGPVRVAIARTEPAYAGRPAVREVERLHLDTIAAARRSIYIENQYLSSRSIADALCASLARRRGPEIVAVLPRECSGWLEENTLGVLRRGVMARLRAADRHARLRLCYPRLPGDRVRLHVHSKLMIVDAQSVRIGSANLSNRSLGLDTECDVLIEAAGDPAAARGIAALQERLLAEHLGSEPERVAQLMRETRGSLLATLDRLGGGERTLAPLEPRLPDWVERIVPLSLSDPEGPFEALRGIEAWTPDLLRDPQRRRLAPALAAFAALAPLARALARRAPARLVAALGVAGAVAALVVGSPWLRRSANLQSECKPFKGALQKRLQLRARRPGSCSDRSADPAGGGGSMAQHSAALQRIDMGPDVSVGRALDLAQRIAVGRLRVLELDWQQRAFAALRRSAWVSVGAFCLVVAWLGLLAAAVVALESRLPLPTSLLLVSASQILLGGGLIACGLRSRAKR